MKNLVMMAAAILLGASLHIGDAEAAKRLGGGSSSGMQRQSVTTNKTAEPAKAPQQAATPAAPQPAGAATAQPKRSWMGPLAGLAAGLGLAALASHFGFGEELASMLMIGLLVMGVLMVVGFLMRKKAAGPQPAYAGAQQGGMAPEMPASAYQAAQPVAGSAAPTANEARIPADFDTAGFVRNAKVMFIRLQAANDARNLDDIREFTSPEMFGEIKLAFSERGAAVQETDVAKLEAQVLDVVEEGANYVVSVQFDGLIREEKNGPAEPFAEMWHLTKPRDGSRGWVLAGIQQIG
jgi:predicted lipid-binding transport protein (Tim44 family)